jgi:hypothetical protein
MSVVGKANTCLCYHFLFLKGSLKKLYPTFIGKEMNIKMV